jgi:hypothetical protein
MIDRLNRPDLSNFADLDGELEEPVSASAPARWPTGLAASLGRIGGILPRPVLAGLGSALAIVLAALIGVSTLGGHGSAEAIDPAWHELALEADGPGGSARLDAPATSTPRPFATRPPAPSQAPSGPGALTATPTPPVWERTDGGWIGTGTTAPDRLSFLRPSRLLLFDDAREAYTIVTRFAILLAAGDMRPWFGILLSYSDERNNTRLEFFSDSYDQYRPYMGLYVARGNEGGGVESTSRVGSLEFWGRDTHEIRVLRGSGRVRLILDGRTIRTWNAPTIPVGEKKGMFVWGGSRMRVDSFEVQ